MKKKWMLEAVYIIAALSFIVLCIVEKSGEKSIRAVFKIGETTIPTQELQPTSEPELSSKSTPIPTGGVTEDGPVMPTPTGEVTPELQVTVTPEDTVTPKPEDIVSSTPESTATPIPESTATPIPEVTPTSIPEPTKEVDKEGRLPGAEVIVNENYEEYDNTAYSWWFTRKKNHIPSGSGEKFPIEPFSAYYLNKEVTDEDKVIYLTFDCGYENGFTPSILDTLAEKDVKVTFFVAKDFVRSNPEYVIRMKEEGHMVGNHTIRHLSSPSLTAEELEEELIELAKYVKQKTGYDIDPYFRPPMGKYSERTLKVTQDMGYSSVFWSIAYYDYDIADQPGKEYVVEHFRDYHHNGTIVLMHNVSESNAQALAEVIDLLKAEGYRFGSLSEFMGNTEEP